VIERECPVCLRTYGADLQRLKHGRQTTCSRACSYSLRGQNKVTSVTESCGVCGNPVTQPPSKRLRTKCSTPFCSRDCHYRARSMGLVDRVLTKPMNIPQHTRLAQADRMRSVNAVRKAAGLYGQVRSCQVKPTGTVAVRRPRGWPKGTCPPEVRAKISLGVAKAIAEGRIPRVSKLELEVGDVLRRLGIATLPQYAIHDDRGRFAAVVDYFLPDFGVALEVNGTFWHSDPRAYPNGPEKPSQERTATQYARKEVLLRQRGIPLVEVWEIDFKANPELAVRSALSAWLHPTP